MNYTAAFRILGVQKLLNPQWSVSGWNDRQELVVSLWAHLFVSDGGLLVYEDEWSRWGGAIHGRNALRAHLSEARVRHSTLRLILGIAHNRSAEKLINSGRSAARLAEYAPREDLLGKVDRVDDIGFKVSFFQHKEQQNG